MNFYIITGASRGLGDTIAKKLLAVNNQIYCLSRTVNNNLIAISKNKGFKLFYDRCDLSNPVIANETLYRILDKIMSQDATSVTLINNAATIEPIRPIDRCDETEILNNFNVNLLTPVIFTATFIRNLGHLDIEKRIVNISSTGAHRVYDGLSCYVSSKAALSQFTKCVAEEQKLADNPVKMILFEPGSMNTGMQDKIVTTPQKDFSRVNRFRQVKRQGLLGSVEAMADKVISLLDQTIIAVATSKISRIFMTAVIYLPELEW